MATMNTDHDVTEAIEAVDADVVEEVTGDGIGEVDSDEEYAPATAGEGDGPNVYTVLLIVSTVAYAAATAMVLNALKQYVDPAQWPLW